MSQAGYDELLVIVAVLALLDNGTPSNVRNISYVLKGDHPIATLFWLAIGRTAAYILCAPLLYFISSYMAENKVFQSVTTVLLGLILVRVCKLIWKSPADHKIPVYPSNGRFRLNHFGLKDKLYGIPLAIPFVIAVDELYAAEISFTEVSAFVLIYLLFHQVPMSMMMIIRIVSSRTNDLIFRTLRTTAGTIERYYSSIALALISAYLLLSGLHDLIVPYL
jgi:hypothetical protein